MSKQRKTIEISGDLRSKSATTSARVWSLNDGTWAKVELATRLEQERRAGSWFERVTDGVVTADMLRQAAHRKTIGKRGRPNTYSVAEVASLYDHAANQIANAIKTSS